MPHILSETATLADALIQATRVAPETGDGFEKFQGVLIERTTDSEVVLVSATDGTSTWQRHVPVIESSGDVNWRVSSLLAKFMMQLPLSDGATIEVRNEPTGRLTMEAGKTRGTFAVLDPHSYPRFHVDVDRDATALVSDLAAKLKQIRFAVSDETGSVLEGVHLNGHQMIACNKHMAARVPFEIPVSKPITAALRELSGALKRTDEMHVGAIGDRLILMPDEDTVITTAILLGDYPDVDRLWKNTAACDQVVEFDSAEALSVLARILILCRTDQYPTTSVTFTAEAIVLDMDVPDVGRVTDEFECKGDIEDFTIKFSPRDLRDAFTAAAGSVRWSFQRNPLKSVRIDGYGDFSTVFMPKHK